MENLCNNCIYDGSVFEFCDDCRVLGTSLKPPHKQYDEFYKDCTTDLQIEPCMVALGSCHMTPPSLDEYTDFDKTKFNQRSDIPAPSFFIDNVNQLKGYQLQPKEIKYMLNALKSPQQALASWEFNETFVTQSSYFEISATFPSFKEEYDMKVVDEIIDLAKKIKKITRVS